MRWEYEFLYSLGQISIKNLKRVARELGETMTEEELREMIERADSNGDGEISPEVKNLCYLIHALLLIYSYFW